MQIQASRKGEVAGEDWATRSQAFVLIDLFSQGRAVQRYVRAWPKIEVLTWLNHWGTLDSGHHAGFPETYIFRSWCGQVATFTLENGTFTFLGDNATALPPEEDVA